MYTQKTISETLKEFETDSANGLSSSDLPKRRAVYGLNELDKEKKKSILALFLEQLNDPLIFVLIIAAGISILLGEISDSLIIAVVVLLNSIIGIIQEGKAMRALDALKEMTSPSALVRRDGTLSEIPAKDLLPGDLVILEAGRQVPADLRLTETMSLRIEESSLTGESIPVEKDASFLAKKAVSLGDSSNMALMSTNVIYGRGEGIVVATGMRTEIGKIAHSITHADQEATPLQKRLSDLGKLLSCVAVVLCAVLFLIAILQRRNIPEMLITAISLAVAAVPEGLPAVVTIVLALSVSRMVAVHAIVRRLPSVETLGCVSVVCSDKTGTLTQNQMRVTECYCEEKIFPVRDLNPELHSTLIEGFLLCNDASATSEGFLGDPTETALIAMAAPGTKEALEKQAPRIHEIPFDSKRKLMTTVHRKKSSIVVYTKGSVEELLKNCSHILIRGKYIPLNAQHRNQILSAAESMSSKALRTLALATKKNESDSTHVSERDLCFVGMVGMIDPPREGVKESIETFRCASVKTAMITGDHVNTAFAIAKDLGIATDPSQCITGQELDLLSDEELKSRSNHLSVFARVSPEHKVRIVKALKNAGHIVAMTGDGVNDAPSLRAADIGIAMGKNGTDVARSASDLILTDDDFTTIEKAIREGRGIYENIKKAILFLLSSNFGEIITMFLSILIWLPSPLKASHILWINLITDSLPALALGVDPNHSEALMKRPPRSPKESLFAHKGLFLTLLYGSLIAAISLIAFLTIPYGCLIHLHLPLTPSNINTILADSAVLMRSQTYAFTVLGLSQLFHAIGMRDIHTSVFQMNHLENKLMIASFAAGFLLQFLVTEIPSLLLLFGTARLSLIEWLSLLLLSAIPLLVHELLIQLKIN